MIRKNRLLLLLVLVQMLVLQACGSPAPSSEVVAFTDIQGESTPASVSPIDADKLTIRETPEGYIVEEESEVETSSDPEETEYDISLMAVGDDLIHMGVVYTGKQPDGTYDFSFLFQGISEFLDKADIKIINQETILGGNQLGFSGYPHFNSPTEVGDAIANAGFNVVLQASNHSADQGVTGIDSCVTFWSTHPEVLLTGIHAPYSNMPPASTDSSSSLQDTAHIPLVTIKDTTFAILNYTYGPNYEVVSNDLAQRLDLLCNRNEQNNVMDFTSLNPQVIQDITEAKNIADIVIVCPHWGTEYQTEPSSYQKDFAIQMAEAGADLIIGTHPHVPQPVEWIHADNGNTALCYYSLGNYVSTQKNGRSMLEALAWVTFHVTEDGITISKDKTGVVPLVCHYTSSPVRIENVYLLENYTQELAARHGIISYGGISFSLNDLLSWSNETFGDWTLSADSVLTPD